MRLHELENLSSDPTLWDSPQKAQDTLKELNAVKQELGNIKSIESGIQDIKDLSALAEDSDTTLLKELDTHANELAKKMKMIEREAKFSDPHDVEDALISVHAGAGGTEACDWAEMLTRMYERFAESKGFPVEITDILMGEEAGIKSITFFIRGTHAFGLLKGETGVHRLVRISPFDANKRRHTSFASVDVLPDIKDDIEIKIEDKDIRVDTYRAHGAGGQHINKTDSAIRITHLPTNIVVACQNQRSQIKNREQAMKVLKIRLYELEQEKKRQAFEKRYDDKGDIAWGNQIRSYVFMPYQLVKDTRSEFETSQVEKVMDGELDEMIDAYLEYLTTTKLKGVKN